MVGETQEDKRSSSLAREKRAFTRNAIFLVGECLIPQQPVRAIEILDFCPGGVFLSYPLREQTKQLPVLIHGDTIEIRCTVPMASGAQPLRFQGRVARADHAGTGIAFINPSFEALHILYEYAKNTSLESSCRVEQTPEREGIAGADSSTTELIIRACSQLVEERLEPMAKSFLEKVAEHFFNLAGEVRIISEKNAYYAALNILSKDGATFTSEFLARMQNRLRQTPLVSRVATKASQPAGEADVLTLSLIEEDVFEDWVAFTGMARTAELEHKEQLYSLELRLSVLFNQAVNNENDPFGPGSISQIFQEALGILSLDRKVVAESCKVFKKVLCDQTGELYAALNRHLIDSGVLPVLHPPGKSPQPVHSERAGRVKPPLQSEMSLLSQPEAAPAASVTGLGMAPVKSAEGFPPSDASVPSLTQPFPPMPPTSGAESTYAVPAAMQLPSQDWHHLIQGLNSLQQQLVTPPAGLDATLPGTPMPSLPQHFLPMSPAVPGDIPWGGGASIPGAEPLPTNPAAMQQPSQDWYHLIQGLNSLQQQLAVSLARPGVPLQTSTPTSFAKSGLSIPATPLCQAEAPAEQPAESRQFTTDEVLLALSRIRPESPDKKLEGNFQQNFMRKLQSELADTSQSAETREVPRRETNILEFGGNLFDSVLSDKLVADTVKPWLNQLSIPLIKMALRDDSLFYDKSHLARQLINRIAELELFGDVSKVENAVRKKVDGLLAEIAGADEITPALLQKMLKEVGMLVNVQNKAFEGNVRDLRAICEANDQQVKSEEPTGKTSALSKLLSGLRPLADEEAPAEDVEALREYKKQARRLKIGSWLMLQHNEVNKRIRLAWVAKDLEKYVFVNVQGLREETLSQNELAEYLRKGEAVVLDEGNEQLVDRAQSTMLQKMHRQLLHETSHDQLTGLINRREFEKKLTETLARVRDLSTLSMLCYFDLEQFNIVNNTFGYEGGDRALVEASRLLNQELGEMGVLARIGGDEFAMLFENCSLEDALQVTSRQAGAFRDYRFSSGDKSLSLSFSAGLVAIDPESESIETLLQAAEASCRIARSKGTNYVQVYGADEEGLARHLNIVKWVSRIDDALDHDRLELRCQPIVSISGGNVGIHHSEVLLRVPDEQGRQMSPVDFIMAAEHFRRMASVDRWVIEHAFRWMADRRNKLAELGGLAINLSGASLNEEGLIDFVLDQAKRLKIPMDKVCFEITETVGISHLSGASEFIKELKKQSGCTFSLDDFGSGQSSYAYLKNLPVDYLKIDGTFVEKMDQNQYDFAVVKSITEIGHFMGKKIIAERVETESVLKILRQIGVDYAQGYFLGKPRNMRALGG